MSNTGTGLPPTVNKTKTTLKKIFAKLPISGLKPKPKKGSND